MNELSSFLETASTVGFGGLAWYLIVKVIPKLQEQFGKSLKEQQETFKSELGEQRKQCEKEQDRICSIFKSNLDSIINGKKVV